MKKSLVLVYDRIVALCKQLPVPTECPVHSQVWVTFRDIVRNHIELFLNRQSIIGYDVLLYGFARSLKYQPELKFAKSSTAYFVIREQDLGLITCQRIVRHIIISPGKTSKEGMGNILSLYNAVFVPTMKEYLLNRQSHVKPLS
jgi:hypothetical protein